MRFNAVRAPTPIPCHGVQLAAGPAMAPFALRCRMPCSRRRGGPSAALTDRHFRPAMLGRLREQKGNASPMNRLLAAALIAGTVALVPPVWADMPMSPIYPTSPRKSEPAAQVATPAKIAAPAPRAAAPESEPVATAAIPPLPPAAASPSENASAATAAEAASPTPAAASPLEKTSVAAAPGRKATAETPPQKRQPKRQARRHYPKYYHYPPPAGAVYGGPSAGWGGGRYGPSPYSDAGP